MVACYFLLWDIKLWSIIYIELTNYCKRVFKYILENKVCRRWFYSKFAVKYISDLDSRAVCEEGLGALWVIKRSVANTPPRGSNGEVATVVQVARTVAVLGCFIDYLEKTIKFRLAQSYIIAWQKMIKLSYGTLSCWNISAVATLKTEKSMCLSFV